MSGQDLALNIHIASAYNGPGTYRVGSLLDGAGELRLQVGTYAGASSSGAGPLTIAADGKSGSVDADLSGGEHVFAGKGLRNGRGLHRGRNGKVKGRQSLLCIGRERQF